MQTLLRKYIRKSRLCLSRGEPELALKAVDSALFIDKDDADALQCKIEILCSLGSFRAAVTCLQQVLQLHPYRPCWVLELSDLLVNQLKQPERALHWLSRLLRGGQLSEVERRRAYQLKVEALIDLERLYEAWLTSREAINQHAEDLNLLFLHGWVSLQLGRFYASATTFQKILRQEPSHADAHYYLGVAYEGLGEHELTRRQFATTYRLDRLFPPVLRHSREEFDQIVAEVMEEQQNQGVSLHLRTADYPAVSVLDDFPHDPRRMGSISPCQSSIQKLYEGDVLVLYHWNVERYCFNDDEIRREVCLTIQQELTENTAVSQVADSA